MTRYEDDTQNGYYANWLEQKKFHRVISDIFTAFSFA
jgi:hypothetical protein